MPKGHLKIPWIHFQQYFYFYSNKTLLTIKGMEMLGNSTRGLLLFHKQLFYRTCILSIVLYGFLL